MDDPALVVHRPGGAVLHRLGHIVDVDIVSEHLPGVPVFGGDWRTGKANKGCVGQGLPDDPGVAHYHTGLLFPLVVLTVNHFFIKAVLPPVGLIRHDHDIPPGRQSGLSPLKLEHSGKDDSVGLPALQQRL